MKLQAMLAYFNFPPLVQLIRTKLWQAQLQKLVTSVETFEEEREFAPSDPIPDYVRDEVKAIYANQPPFHQALLLHGIRRLLQKVLSQHHSGKINRAEVKLLNEITPELHYRLSDDQRTIEMRLNHKIVALIKPGAYRQQSDMFLYNFHHVIRQHLSLDNMRPMFIASYEIEMPFHWLKTTALGSDSEFRVTDRQSGKIGDLVTPLKENIQALTSSFQGGIQEYIQPQPKQDETNRNKGQRDILFLVVTCLLGMRDLKENGVIEGVVVDCEDYLEPKRRVNSQEPLPNLHVPYFEGDLHTKLDMEALREIANRLSLVSPTTFQQVLQDYPYVPVELKPNECEFEVDPRAEYKTKVPVFLENRLLSQEQIHAFQENLQKLQRVLLQLAQNAECDVHELLRTFDPTWGKELDFFMSCYLAFVRGDERYKALFKDSEHEKWSQLARQFGQMTPIDLTGSCSDEYGLCDFDSSRSSPEVARDYQASPIAGALSQSDRKVTYSGSFQMRTISVPPALAPPKAKAVAHTGLLDPDDEVSALLHSSN